MSGSRFPKRFIVACLLFSLILIGTGLGYTKAAAPSSASFDHIVTILMENENFCAVYTGCGGAATYMSNLANSNTLVTNWGTTSHPSEGNYISLIGGSNFGHTSDGYCCWGITAPNVIDRVEGAGLTWQAFAEDASGSGTCSFTPPRNADHFAFKTFSDMNTAARCSHFLTTVSSSDNEFVAALNAPNPANYIWLTPNDCNNMHNCSVSTGDSYLAALVPRILSSTEFTTTKATLFIVFDEGYTTSGCGGGGVTGGTGECVYASFSGPVVQSGIKLNPSGASHYSYLSTIEAAWGLASLTSNDANAPNMLGAFKAACNPCPLATSFTYAPTSPIQNNSVNFTATVTGGVAPYTYSWTFGDGSTGTGQIATHSFATTGTFSVTLNVKDSASPQNNATATNSVPVRSPPPPPLSVSLTVSPSGTLAANQTVTLTASVSGGTAPYIYAWGFGDGGTDTVNPALHSYTANGTYTVTVTVTDSTSPSSTGIATGSFKIGTTSTGSQSWMTVDYDPNFATSASQVCSSSTANSAYSYWHPNVHGAASNCVSISGGVLHTQQNDVASTSWGSFDNAVVHEGNFPWQGDCGHVSGSPPNFACGRNTYGLAAPAQSDFSATLTLNSLNYLSFSGGSNYEYDNFIGLYWYFDAGPVTANGCTQSWTEEQIRFTSWHGGQYDAVGSVSTWCTFDMGYTRVITQVNPGGTYSLNNFDLIAFHQAALAKWGIPSTIHAVLVGIEVGSEGFGSAISVDWSGLKIQTYAPAIVRADVDFNHVIDNRDLNLVQGLVGQCPSNYAVYQWRANAATSNPCIDSNDVAYVQQYLGSSYNGSIITPPQPDFGITTSPTAVNIVQGASATSLTTLTSLGSFVGTVSLSLTSSISGITVAFNPANVALLANGLGSSTLTVSTSSNAPPGSYTLVEKGTSGSLSHSISLSVTINPSAQPDFGITTSPSVLTIIQGASATSLTTLTSLGSFTGAVALTATAQVSGFTMAFSPLSVTLSANGAGASTLTVSTASTLPSGTYAITVTGASGSLSHSISLSATITTSVLPDFGIVANQVSINVIQGSSGTSTVTLTSLSGFVGTVGLSATVSASAVAASFSPSLVILMSGSNGASTLTVSSTSSVSAGTYFVTVTGAAGGISHSTTVSVKISVPPPQALLGGLSWVPLNPAPGQVITLTASATGGTQPYSFLWSFGDGGSASGSVVTHSYVGARNYNVRVVVLDSLKNNATAQYSIPVSAASGGGGCWVFCPLFPTILPTISLVFVGGTIGLLLSAGIFTFLGARRMRLRRGIGLTSPGGRIGALMGQSVVHASFPVIRARAGYRSKSANGTLRKRNRIRGEPARDLPDLGFKMRREKLKRPRYR